MSSSTFFHSQIKPVTWMVLAVALMLALLTAILLSPSRIVYDEFYVDLIVKELIAAEDKLHYLLRDWWIPPGPVHMLVYYPLHTLVGSAPLVARLVNLCLFASVLTMIVKGLRAWGVETHKAWLASASVLAIPAVWLIGGLALTEMPSMTALTLGLFLLSSQMRIEKAGGLSPGWTLRDQLRTIGAGLCLGTAILGRQPHLLVLPFVVACALLEGSRRPTLVTLLLAIVPIPAAFFLYWGGLVAPLARYADTGARWEHGMFSIFYLGAYLTLMCPFWLIRVPWKWWLPVAAAASVANISVFAWERPLAESLFLKFGTAYISKSAWDFFGGTVCMAMSAATLACFAYHSWRNRRDYVYLASAGAATAIAAGAAGISHVFSSRYPAMALPFLVVISLRHREWTALEFATTVFGAVFGALVLWSHQVTSSM